MSSLQSNTLEGQIDIKVSHCRNAAPTVKISSSRPVYAAQVLEGKSASQALTAVPLLFNVCAVAQSVAAVSAIESARGTQAADSLVAARQGRVWVETLREHFLRLFLDWPNLLKEKIDTSFLPALMQLLSRMDTLLSTQKDNDQTIGLRDEIASLEILIADKVLAMPPADWLSQVADYASLIKWANESTTIAASLVQHVADNQWQAQARNNIEALPLLDVSELNAVLAGEHAAGFIIKPRWHDKTYETSALTRANAEPLLVNLSAEFGNSVLSRIAARMTELARIPSLLTRHCLHQRHSTGLISSNKGIAQVEAARGRLIHRVVLNADIVTTYQIVAPTEWNFHPQGLIEQALQNLHVTSRDEYLQLAHLTINLIDPCVAYRLH